MLALLAATAFAQECPTARTPVAAQADERIKRAGLDPMKMSSLKKWEYCALHSQARSTGSMLLTGVQQGDLGTFFRVAWEAPAATQGWLRDVAAASGQPPDPTAGAHGAVAVIYSGPDLASIAPETLSFQWLDASGTPIGEAITPAFSAVASSYGQVKTCHGTEFYALPAAAGSVGLKVTSTTTMKSCTMTIGATGAVTVQK